MGSFHSFKVICLPFTSFHFQLRKVSISLLTSYWKDLFPLWNSWNFCTASFTKKGVEKTQWTRNQSLQHLKVKVELFFPSGITTRETLKVGKFNNIQKFIQEFHFEIHCESVKIGNRANFFYFINIVKSSLRKVIKFLSSKSLC